VIEGDRISRRDFLSRTVRIGASAMAGAGVAGLCFDPAGPKPKTADSAAIRSFDFSISAEIPQISVVRGPDRRETLRVGLQALGGIERFIASGDRVLLKVNAAFSSPAALGATTHPELVFEMARHCFAAGARSVTVADNPINDPSACFTLTGIADAAKKAGAFVMLPRPRRFERISIPEGRLIVNWPVFSAPLTGTDKVIGLAPVKDHHRSGASMSLKNWYGLLGGRRNLFHQDIHGIIRELAILVRPTLVVLDGTVSMMANGPTGGSMSDLKRTDTLIVSTDPVAADVLGARLLGRSPAELPFIAEAAAAGAGIADIDRLNIKELKL
jgi:uncharacterized protein (DUF362 family)